MFHAIGNRALLLLVAVVTSKLYRSVNYYVVFILKRRIGPERIMLVEMRNTDDIKRN
jgi:hypothetical protein